MGGIPVLEPAIMEELFWASIPTLSTVHPMEEGVVRLREQLVAALQAALVPLEQYLALYEKWVEQMWGWLGCMVSAKAYAGVYEADGGGPHTQGDLC